MPAAAPLLFLGDGRSGRSPLSSLLHGPAIVDHPTIYLGIQVTAGLRRNNGGKQAEFSAGPPNAGLLIHNGPPTENLTQINNISHSLFVFVAGPVYRAPLAGVNWYAAAVWARVCGPGGHRPAASGRGRSGARDGNIHPIKRYNSSSRRITLRRPSPIRPTHLRRSGFLGAIICPKVVQKYSSIFIIGG